MNGLVTVIMPAYNVGEYIEDSIRSVQKQSYQNWELIVVNDGSTDHTPEVVQKLADEDSRIRLVNQENGGVSRARNHGLDLAKGKYIAFLDGDDFWEPSFVSELVKAIAKYGVGFAYCGYDRLYSWGYRRSYRYAYPSGRILPYVIHGSARPLICSALFNKPLLLDNNIRFTEDCPVGEDQELILKVLALSKAVAVPKRLMVYRFRKNSTIHSKWEWQKHIHSILSYERAADYINRILVIESERREIKKLMTIAIAKRFFRFAWRMYKHGYHKELGQLLTIDKNKAYLSVAKTKELRPLDRIKLGLIERTKPL